MHVPEIAWKHHRFKDTAIKDKNSLAVSCDLYEMLGNFWWHWWHLVTDYLSWVRNDTPFIPLELLQSTHLHILYSSYQKYFLWHSFRCITFWQVTWNSWTFFNVFSVESKIETPVSQYMYLELEFQVVFSDLWATFTAKTHRTSKTSRI